MPKRYQNFVNTDDFEWSNLKNIYPIAPSQIYEDENPLRKTTVPSKIVNTEWEERERTATEKLCNRLILCLFAVCLLWLTSLQLCTAVVGLNIQVPSFSSVATSCNYAYKKVDLEREYYAECAHRQIDQCDEELDAAFAVEKMSVLTSQHGNQIFASSFNNLVSNCTNAVAMSKSAVNAWSSGGVSHLIPYQPTCTGTAKEKTVSALGDSTSSRTSVYTASLDYTQTSDSTVGRMAEYTFALNSYNAAYLCNKTRQLQSLADLVVVDASLPRVNAVKVSLDPISGIFNQVEACLSLSNTTTQKCPYAVNMKELYAYEELVFQWTTARVYAFKDNAQAAWNTFETAAKNVQAAANSFYDSVQGAQGIIQWVKSNTAGLGNLCGKSSPNFCSFSPYSFFLAIPAFPSFPPYYGINPANYLWSQLQSIQLAERLKLDAALGEVGEQTEALVREIRAAIRAADFTPNDYHPPQYPAAYNYSDEPALQAQRSAGFISNVETILSAKNQTPSVDFSGLSRKVNVTEFLDLAAGSLSGVSFTWADFSAASVDVALLIESFLTVQGIFYLFDYIYRTFQTVRLIARFWGRSSIRLPKADLRSKKPEIGASWFVYMDRALKILPFFSIQIFLFAGFIILIIWGFAALFVPEYQSYMNACVHHSNNHTFISRNLNAAAFNYASGDGNAVVGRGVSAYNAQSTEYCTSNAASTLSAYTAVVNQMYADNHTLTTSRNDLRAMADCIDVVALDSLYYQACCSSASAGWGAGADYSALQDSCFHSSSSYVWPPAAQCTGSAYKCPSQDSGEAYLPPGLYMANSACGGDSLLAEDGMHLLSNAYGSTQTAAFDCQVLPKCEVSCVGPDPALVSSVSKHCACMAEWYMNGYILQSLVALVAYILTNLSRIYITKGIVQLLWKELTPQIFEYSANCDMRGRIFNAALRHAKFSQGCAHTKNLKGQETAPADIEECAEDADFNTALGEKIQARVKAFERKGYFLIVFGILLNAPWIVLLFVVKRNIAYNP